MPDIPDRERLERRLARTLGGVGREHLSLISSQLGNPPDISNIPQSTWDTIRADLNGNLMPFVEQVYLDAAERMSESSAIGVDWSLVNEAAAQWARNNTMQIASGINDTTRRAVQASVSAFFDQGLTVGELEQRLSNIFGPTRASLIAQTEVTRAAVQGELQFARMLEAQGVSMDRVWVTNRDERVCPICEPLNGQRVSGSARFQNNNNGNTYDFPPAHPRCRCWLNHEFSS